MIIATIRKKNAVAKVISFAPVNIFGREAFQQTCRIHTARKNSSMKIRMAHIT